MRRAIIILTFLTLLLPSTALADRQGVIGFPVDDEGAEAGNPYVRGIASHAWWLDPEVYGDQLLPALDDLQVTTVRISIDWRRFEPEQDAWDWGMYDRVLSELAARNIVVVAVFNTIPYWASVDQAGCADSNTEPQTCELRSDMYPLFERAMEAAVSRYTWIRHWEFWNEPEMWPHLGQAGPTYLYHLRLFYDIAHAINPEVVVAAQTLTGRDYMEYIYNLSAEAYGAGNEPWDAISIHPYNWWHVPVDGARPFELNYDRINWLRELMIQRGDGDKKMWITEFGWTNEERWQAENLVAALNWMQQQPYIEFAHLHMLHDWNVQAVDQFGLMRIVPDENGALYLGPDTVFEPKEIFYNAFKNYPTNRAGRRPTNPDSIAFSETGHAVSGLFLRVWLERGVEIIGLPITRPYVWQDREGRWLLVQDFERARLEYHPEHIGTPAIVLSATIGWEMALGRLEDAPFQALPVCEQTDGVRCFTETGHTLKAGFLGYWEQHDGMVSFGLPISEEFVENGRTVQYFERARLEWWPELGAEKDIIVAALAKEQLIVKGWLTSDGSVPANSDIRLPTRREFP